MRGVTVTDRECVRDTRSGKVANVDEIRRGGHGSRVWTKFADVDGNRRGVIGDVREMEMWVDPKALRVRVANPRHSRMSDVRRHLPGSLGQKFRR